MISPACFLFSSEDSSSHKEPTVATVTVQAEMQLGVICGLINAILLPPPQILNSWLDYFSPLEHVAFFLVQFKGKYKLS
jgi:hypothetical protein